MIQNDFVDYYRCSVPWDAWHRWLCFFGMLYLCDCNFNYKNIFLHAILVMWNMLVWAQKCVFFFFFQLLIKFWSQHKNDKFTHKVLIPTSLFEIVFEFSYKFMYICYFSKGCLTFPALVFQQEKKPLFGQEKQRFSSLGL